MDAIEKRNKKDTSLQYGIAGANSDTIQSYGSGVKEHVVSYSGMDNENGTRLHRGLKDISNYKINPEYEKQNLRQQAGFSAEVKSAARTNAEKAINGASGRKVRTDDIGHVNDQLYDHVEIDEHGNVIAGSGTQMKFVGNSAEEAWKKLLSKKYQKYHDANVLIEVPADYCDGIISEADKTINDLRDQLKKATENGETERAKTIKERIANCEKIKANLRKSNVSTKEAMEARVNPTISTIKDIGCVSHRAGMEAGKMGMAIGGAVSIVQNIYAMCKGEIEYDEAAKNVAKMTAISGGMGYAGGFCGSAVKGLMQNAESSTLRTLSKTNLPGIAVTVAVDTTKTMLRYFRGEITGLQCFNELGQKGSGMISSAMFAAIGQVAIPIPVIGSLVGGMVGYAMSTASYGVLCNALNEAKLAKEERQRIEKECEEHIRMLREYREQVEKTIQTYLQAYTAIFEQAFDSIKSSLDVGDIDGFISGANAITRALGEKPQFETMDEFENFMSNGSALIL